MKAVRQAAFRAALRPAARVQRRFEGKPSGDIDDDIQCAFGDNRDLNQLLANNKRWVERVNQEEPDFFKRQAVGQSPDYLYIGCSDSRLDPGRMLQLKPGNLFVHRNVGNQCSNDLNFLSVLEYAVSHLKVPHIIVCGHYDCGAVKNSTFVQDIGLLECWIRQIRDVARLHNDELDKFDDREERERRLVELNVIEQCRNVFKQACVQKTRKATSTPELREEAESKHDFATPRVHAMVFDPATGVMKKLDVDFKKDLKDFKHIYNLV